MTRMHFQAAADMIRRMTNRDEADRLMHFCIALFQSFNSRFNAARFEAACQNQD